MFKFFKDPKWFIWAYVGSAIILSSIWVQVQIDVKINEWFGDFYDMIQEALSAPNAITIEEYWASLLSFNISRDVRRSCSSCELFYQSLFV